MFHITGALAPSDYAAILFAFLSFASALSRHTGTPPYQAFMCVVGSIEIRASYNIPYLGYVTNETMYLIPGEVTNELVLHEIGHVFSDRVDDEPYYYTYGMSVAGNELGTDDNPVEVWSDMFMNWVLDSFDNTPDGDFQYYWVESHMDRWVDDCLFVPPKGIE